MNMFVSFHPGKALKHNKASETYFNRIINIL